MLLLNIFLSATRAAIIPFLIGIIFFIILDKGISKIIKYTLIGIILIVLVYPVLPESITGYFGQMFDSIVDVMSPHGTGGEKYGGSTVDARAMQIGAEQVTQLYSKPNYRTQGLIRPFLTIIK